MRIDWISKLRHALQVWAFALAITAIQYAFTPERPWQSSLVYALLISTITWGVIDLGRELSRSETGWPKGIAGLVLVVAGIVAGYFGGTSIADAVCKYYNLYGDAPRPSASDLRNSILVTVLAGIVGSYYFYSVNKSRYLERKMGEARTHANEARLKLLEAQLEPHMLFNTLANLRVLIGSDARRAEQMLDHMIAYLRATLSASRSTTHTLQAEFDRLRDYLELMAVRMGPRMTYTLDLPADLANHRVPTLLLQPLVENSIKHGLEPKVEGGSITVSARREGGHIVLEVNDTGVGLPADGGGSGFGMAQVRERLLTLYGDSAAINLIAAQAGGTRASITFPSQNSP